MEENLDLNEDLDFSQKTTRRRPWLIVLLTILFSSFVFVYCGRLRRAIAWFFISWIPFLLSIAVMLYTPHGKVAVLGGVAILIGTKVAIIVDALNVGRQQFDRPLRSYQRWWAYLLLVMAFGFADGLVKRGIVDVWQEAFILPTGGMRETLLPGDRILVDKLAPRFGLPRREQVAVFFPNDRAEVAYVQRVIALPGDQVQIDEGKVLINGEVLEQPYANFIGDKTRLPEMENFGPVDVPAAHFFVLGDNRWNSRDSRFHGFVPEENFIGIAKVIFWSREREFVQPNRANPAGTESWGKLRIDRIGKLIQ